MSEVATVPWSNRHAQRYKTPLERFREKYTVNPETGCWEWQAMMKPSGDYGLITIDNKPRQAHRISYEYFVGEIPEGLQIDHLCRNTRCVNPSHLEAVTGAENRRRQREAQTHCHNGHPLSGENLSLIRVCRTCRRANEKRHVAKKRRAS